MLLVFLGVPVPSEVSNLYVLNRYEALSPYTPIPIFPYTPIPIFPYTPILISLNLYTW